MPFYSLPRWLAPTLLVVVYALRFLVVIPVQRAPEVAYRPDSIGYMSIAERLMERGDFQAGGPDLTRPPIYPAFLAASLALSGGSETVVVFIQFVFGGGIGAALYQLGRLLGKKGVGFSAALIFGLMPNPILWSTTLLSDVLFAFLLIWTWYFLIKYLVHGGWQASLLSGFGLGLAILTRPVGLIFIPLWIGVVLVGSKKRIFKSEIWKGGLVILLMVGVLCLPWAYRNLRIWDQFTISPIASRNIREYVAPAVMADVQGISLEQARTILEPLSEQDQVLNIEYWKIILRHPISYLKLYALGIASTIFGPGHSVIRALLQSDFQGSGAQTFLLEGRLLEMIKVLWEYLNSSESGLVIWLTVSAFAFQLASYTLAVLGWTSQYRSGKGVQRVIAVGGLLVLAILLLIPGPVGNSRFRVPADPFLAWFAAAGVIQLWRVREPEFTASDPTIGSNPNSGR